MRWPWSRATSQLRAERARAAAKQRELEAAERRHEAAVAQARELRATTAVLADHLQRNGFTELLRKSMGAR